MIPNHGSQTGVQLAKSVPWMLFTWPDHSLWVNIKKSRDFTKKKQQVWKSWCGIPVWYQSARAEYQLSSYTSHVLFSLPRSSASLLLYTQPTSLIYLLIWHLPGPLYYLSLWPLLQMASELGSTRNKRLNAGAPQQFAYRYLSLPAPKTFTSSLVWQPRVNMPTILWGCHLHRCRNASLACIHSAISTWSRMMGMKCQLEQKGNTTWFEIQW